ncbi:hypothetical protein JHK82_030173 [Glycine max]|nr:hypothetical protein JHK85_030800 [Glycine max]KAG5123436.1 hypothetical protein JHK82_030173 [Glycine max]KAG5144855.1 hypothetical protein JHK84_030398 [Glycine max]
MEDIVKLEIFGSAPDVFKELGFDRVENHLGLTGGDRRRTSGQKLLAQSEIELTTFHFQSAQMFFCLFSTVETNGLIRNYVVNFTEPMLTIGSINPVMWNDDWTVVTEDGSLSAQFEHTILITPDGAEIMTEC